MGQYDRASVIEDAVEYVKELLQTVNELKILVEKKRRAREMSKGHNEEDSIENKGHEHESSSVMKPLGDQIIWLFTFLEKKIRGRL